MQPQQPSPSQQYSFITEVGQTPAPGASGPRNFKRIAIFGGIGAVVLCILIIILSSVLGGGGGNKTLYISLGARSQEIIRVSKEVNQLAPDVATQNISSTVIAALNSQQQQIITYASSQKIKLAPAQLNGDVDSTVDTEMKTAATNGNINSVYGSYLKTELGRYNTSLSTAYKSAGPEGKVMLKAAFDSNQVILNSTQVANAQ